MTDPRHIRLGLEPGSDSFINDVRGYLRSLRPGQPRDAADNKLNRAITTVLKAMDDQP